MPSGVPYIVDYDDAVFHNYDLSDNTLVRRLLGQKIDRVMAGAATVICGNGYLADRAEQAGAKRVERVPTVVNIERYTPVPVTSNASPVIGWIGSPSTQHYLLELRTVFERLHRLHGIRLVLVGATLELAQQFGSVPVDVLPWSEEMEAEHVAGFDIGIMPLRDGPWERGKCGYKLIQYMACAKPVVASPVGVNTEIVQGRDCGLLATSHEQWFSVITQLLNDTALRAELGKRGRVAVERHYSLQVQAPRMAKILCGAAAREP
ncbi:MAG: glycosyltransferase family 4 protein [Pseudohongiellaceae bacterium]